MDLRGQHGLRSDRGYAMAALLVALGVMAVMMSAALPAWRHQARREKEAELIFRGEQYVRAISLFERKMGPGARPPNFDILVDQKFLRKKYKDPITNDEFQPIFVGQTLPGPGRGGGSAPPGARGGRGSAQGPEAQQPQPQTPFGQQPQQQGIIGAGIQGAGIQGVVSKSRDTSIRVYKGQTTYNTWQFIHAGAGNMPGGRGVQMPGGGPRSNVPGPGRGGRGVGPGGRGTSPFGPGPGTGPGTTPGGRGPGAPPGAGTPQGPGTPPPGGRGRGGL